MNENEDVWKSLVQRLCDPENSGEAISLIVRNQARDYFTAFVMTTYFNFF